MKKKVIYSIMSAVLTLIPLININAIKMTKTQRQFNIVPNEHANIYKPKKNLNFHHDLNFIDTPEIKKSQTPLKTTSNIYIKKQLHQNFQNLINDPKKMHSPKNLKTTPQLYIPQNYLKNSNNKDLNIKIDNIQDTENDKFLQYEFDGIPKREKIPNSPMRKILVNKLEPKYLISNFNENPKNINSKNTYNDIYKEKMKNPQKNKYCNTNFRNKPITNLRTNNFDDFSFYEDEINYEENDSIADLKTIIEMLGSLNGEKKKNPQKNKYCNTNFRNKPITNLRTNNFDDFSFYEDEINYEENDSIADLKTIIEILGSFNDEKKKNIPKEEHTIKKHNTDFNKNPNKIKKAFENLNIKKHNKNNIEIYDKIMIQKKQNAKNIKNLIYRKKIKNMKPKGYYKKSL